MIQSSFLHLPGVGETTERKLWDQGVRSWDDLESGLSEIFGAKKAAKIAEGLEESRSAFESGEFRYFCERMKGSQVWRLLPMVHDAIAYLDIETTGLGFPPMSHSTTIAVWFKGELFVEHEPKRKQELLDRLEREAKMFVTFNGLSFDLPFLRREFDLELRNPHLDLRLWFRAQGVSGGLKRIQASFPEVPQRSSMDIDGFDAVRLWRMHKRGIAGALETLMTYNAEDSICLEPLMHLAYAREQVERPHLDFAPLTQHPRPEIATSVDPFVYDLLRGRETIDLPQDW
jgi:uncharacterized protein YprB with RNaseH-like and TPR domain